MHGTKPCKNSRHIVLRSEERIPVVRIIKIRLNVRVKLVDCVERIPV